MRHRRWTAALAVGQDRKAPSEFRIWRAGDNTTDFGPSLFTERSALEVMAEYGRRGNKLSFDYEHLSVPENRKTDEPPLGGGYFEIEVRKSAAGPELWATSIEWSDEARRQIEQGERRYFSPDFYQDEKTNEIVRLNKIALCIDPATHRLNLLATRSGKKRTTLDKAKLMALLLALRDTADESQKGQIDEAMVLLATDAGAVEPSTAAEGEEKPTTAVEVPDEPKPGQARATAAAPVRAAAGAPVRDVGMLHRLASLERRFDNESNTRLVQANRDLIPETSPALELWALRQSPANLDTWIKAQRASKPKPAPAGGHQVQQRKASAAAGGAETAETFDPESIQLSDADRAVLKRTGGNAKKHLDHKRTLAARKLGVDWTPSA